MQLHQLRYFVAIVQCGSVTKAADRCHVSQPSMSQQLSKLEDGIGRKLFSREKGRLVLTDAGRVMYEQATNILAKVEETKRRMSAFDNDSGGNVAIGVLPTLAPFMLPGTLLSLSARYPDAAITVREEVSEALVDAAGRGELDVLIESLPLDDTRLRVEPLFQDEFRVAVHCDNPLARLDEVPIDALDDLPFILLEDIHCLTRQVEQYCFNERFVPKVLFQASQLATVKQLVELRYGVSILPQICIDDDAESVIRYLRLSGKTPARQVVIATPKDRYLGSAAQYFVSVVKEHYRSG